MYADWLQADTTLRSHHRGFHGFKMSYREDKDEASDDREEYGLDAANEYQPVPALCVQHVYTHVVCDHCTESDRCAEHEKPHSEKANQNNHQIKKVHILSH